MPHGGLNRQHKEYFLAGDTKTFEVLLAQRYRLKCVGLERWEWGTLFEQRSSHLLSLWWAVDANVRRARPLLTHSEHGLLQ